MRLIDADKLLPKLWVCYEENKPIVDGEPTVEAIPIAWIKQWANEHCMYCLDYDYPTEKYDGWYDINSMIKDWKKENEQNKETTSQAD